MWKFDELEPTTEEWAKLKSIRNDCFLLVKAINSHDWQQMSEYANDICGGIMAITDEHIINEEE